MIYTDDDGDVTFYIPSVSLSSYGVGCSFKTLVPLPVISEDDEMSSASLQAKEDESSKPDDNNSLDLTFSAGISGKLQPIVQEIRFTYEDGSQETKEVYTSRCAYAVHSSYADIFQVPLALALIAKNTMSLGASAGYVLGDMATRKGLFGRRPFSFLSDTAVSSSISLLPTTAMAVNFAKAVTPVPRAYPFNVNFSTALTGSLTNPSPILGLGISKPIGDRKAVFCSWSSGSLPQLVHEPELAIRNQLSKFSLGFILLPAGRPQENDSEDKVQRQGSKSEAFQFQVEASPVGGSLSLNYSRDLFSGKPADDDLPLSEWGSEGYHPSSLNQGEQRRSVRLEIATTVGFNLALGWNITGLRRVGEFTRVGLGVGVQGDRGLVMTFSWRRLGQKINIPIALCPVEMATADVAALTVVLPWVTYCAVEFGLLRPRARKNRRRVIAQRRKELKRLIPRKRERSRQTVELMREQVRRQQSREEARNGLVVTKAEYGVQDNNNDGAVIDVTIPVAALVNHSQLIIPRETVKVRICY